MQINRNGWIASFMIVVGLLFWASLVLAGFASGAENSRVLAKVDDIVITEDEFNREIASLHQALVDSGSDSVNAPSIDFPGVMNRLINLRLLALEARSIGLDQQPDFVREMEQYRNQQLKQRVLGLVVMQNPVTTDDPEVQKMYRRLAREMRMNSMLFERHQDAQQAAGDIAERGFAVVAKELKTASGVQLGMEEEFLPLKSLSPYVGKVVIDMEVGGVSPVFRATEGFMIFELAEVRQVEDEGVRQEALSMVTQERHQRVKSEFLENLVDQYAEIDMALLEKVDFNSSGPAIEELKSDTRVLAEIKVPGQEQAEFTVADLTEAFSDKYYHGLEQARKSKDLNRDKEPVLRKRLMSRLLLAEAIRLGIDQSPDFMAQMSDYENRMLFAVMVRKVIGPDVTFTPQQVEKYYAEHTADYTTPEMVRISSIPFAQRDAAEQSADMLAQGADYSWISKNAPGQVRTDAANLTRIDSRVVSMTGMPEDVHNALHDVQPRETAIYEDGNGYYQLVFVEDVIPGQVKPLADVRVEVEKTVFRNNVSEAVNAYAEKARDHYEVTIYDPELRQQAGIWERVKSFFD